MIYKSILFSQAQNYTLDEDTLPDVNHKPISKKKFISKSKNRLIAGRNVFNSSSQK